MLGNIKAFAENAKNMARSPLGIIALALLLVYGIASLVTCLGSFSQEIQLILVIFIVIYPFFVLFLFYNLVTKHFDKVYAPSDFKEDSSYLKLLELSLKKTYLKSPAQLAQEVMENVTKDSDSSEIKKEIEKSIIKSMLMQYGSFTIKILNYAIDGRVSFKIDKQNTIVMTIFDGVQKGCCAIKRFYEDFFSLHNKNIISIKKMIPFEFIVSDFAITAIRDLFDQREKSDEDSFSYATFEIREK